MPEITEDTGYASTPNPLKKKSDADEDLNSCLESATAEHARLDDMDEPCDDGRGA